MIPADHIHFNDDGTAWMIVREFVERNDRWWDSARYLSDLDRPCDTCDGVGCSMNGLESGDHGPLACEHLGCCPDCIDGRHTFEIEVEGCVCDSEHGYVDSCPGNQWHRVSIVPGMVLPIYGVPMPLGTGRATDWGDADEMMLFVESTPQPFIGIMQVSGTAYLVDVGQAERITLPPAAKPGVFAVKLTVSS